MATKYVPKNRRALIIGLAIMIPICGYGLFAAVSKLYGESLFTNLPTVPTFGYSTPTGFTTPLSFSTPISTLSTVSVFATTTGATNTPSVTPTFTITPLPFFTPTNAFYTGTPISQSFYYIYPTLYRSPTPQPTFTPTATKTLPSSPPAPKAGVACNNILYPVRPGTAWSYFVSSGTHAGIMNMNVTSVQDSFGNVVVTNTVNGQVSQVQVVCDNDIILSFPFLDAQTLLGNALNGSMTVNYAGGVLAPNESAFLSSNWALSWSSQYTIFGNGSLTYNGNLFNIIITPSTINMTCQTLGVGNAAFETVTVAAGTYNALKVICTGQGTVTGSANGSPITGTVTAQSTQWFAPNVGPVRIRADAANLTVFGITIPFNPSGVGLIELQSFVPGP